MKGIASMSPIARKVLWIVALGTAIRVRWVRTVHRPLTFDYSDMHQYIEQARHLADPSYQSVPMDWYYPSGTSAALSLFLRVFGGGAGWQVAALGQAMVSGAKIWLLFVAARRYFGERIAFWAALALAFHYLDISYTGYFLSETWLGAALMAACAALVPERPLRCALAGLLLGFGVWVKPQVALLVILWASWLGWRRAWTSGLLLIVGASAIVVPVSLVVSLEGHRPTFISYNGGQTFALGQCPFRSIRSTDATSGAAWEFGLPLVAQRAARGETEAGWAARNYSEPFLDSMYYVHQGLQCIRQSPIRATTTAGRHLADSLAGPPWSTIQPWPDAGTAGEWRFPGTHWSWTEPYRCLANVSNLIVSYLVFPLALLGMWRTRRDAGTALIVFCPLASVAVTAVLFHGDPRFRVPYDFSLFVAAAAAVTGLFRGTETTTSSAGSVEAAPRAGGCPLPR